MITTAKMASANREPSSDDFALTPQAEGLESTMSLPATPLSQPLYTAMPDRERRQQSPSQWAATLLQLSRQECEHPDLERTTRNITLKLRNLAHKNDGFRQQQRTMVEQINMLISHIVEIEESQNRFRVWAMNRICELERSVWHVT